MLNNLLIFNNSSSSIVSSNNVETLIPANNALTLENGINEPILKNILSLNFYIILKWVLKNNYNY